MLVRAYVEGQFNKWLFGFKSTVEALIKKDGVAYVTGLLARMKALAPRKALFKGPEPSASVPVLASNSGRASPEQIHVAQHRRQTPPRRESLLLTPKPTKARAPVGDLLTAERVAGAFVVLLLAVLFWQIFAMRSELRALSAIPHVAVPAWKERADVLHQLQVARQALANVEALLKRAAEQ